MKTFSYLVNKEHIGDVIKCYVVASSKLDASVKIINSNMREDNGRLQRISKLPDPIPILK